MVQTTPRTAASPTGEAPTAGAARPLASRRLEGLTGIAITLLMAGNLGLPLSGHHLAIDVLMLTIGFRFARSLRRSAAIGQPLQRFWLCQLGPIIAPTLVAVALATTYGGLDQLDEAQLRGVLGGVTMTFNLFAIHGGAEFEAIQHLWVIGAIVQFAVIAPVLVLAGRRHLSAERRAAAILGLAFGVALCRFGFLLTGSAGPESIAIHTLTRSDALLAGLAIGVAPIAALRNRLPAALTPPAFAMLLLLFISAPSSSDMPTVSLGVMVAAAVALAGAVTAWSVTGRSDAALEATLGNLVFRWLGKRALSIYIWHQLFGLTLLADGLPSGTPLQEWPGVTIFVVRVVFSLAAAATSYRYLELPIRAVARQVLADGTPAHAADEPRRRTERSPTAAIGASQPMTGADQQPRRRSSGRSEPAQPQAQGTRRTPSHPSVRTAQTGASTTRTFQSQPLDRPDRNHPAAGTARPQRRDPRSGRTVGAMVPTRTPLTVRPVGDRPALSSAPPSLLQA